MKTAKPYARFWCCDLQTHSPLEREFRPGVDPNDGASVAAAAEKYVQTAVNAGLDAIAITDHNSVAFVPALTNAAKGRLLVFPGVEISAADGYHLLCLFEPGTAPGVIQDFLTRIGITKGDERWPNGDVRTAGEDFTFGRLLKEISKRDDAIAIAPHIRRKKGLLKNAIAGEVRARYWRSPELLAVEDDRLELKGGTFADDVLLRRKDDYHREREPARIWGSDCKSYDELGSRRTFIKMVEPSIEGLRQAFLDPGSRIHHPNEHEQSSRDRVVDIRWDGGFLAGQGISFSEQLSCLIGGKGTGKSTVIESLRFAFEAEHSQEPLRGQYEKLAETALPPGTRVDVRVERSDGSEYVISRTSGYPAEVRNRDDDPLELAPREVIDPAVYSQGEILDIARRPASHLTLLDSFIEDELADLRSAEHDVLEELARNRTRLVDALERDEQRTEDAARIARLREAKKAFDTKGVSDRTELRRQLDREARLVEEMKNEIAAARSDLKSIETHEVPPELLIEQNLPHRKLWTDLKPEWDKVSATVAKLRTDALAALDSFAETAETATSPGSEWAMSVQEKREDAARVYRELQEDYPELNLAQFDRIDRELERLEVRTATDQELVKLTKTLWKERDELLRKLTETRRKQFRLRDDLASSLNDSCQGSVQVEVAFQGTRDDFVERLGELRTRVRKEALRALAEHSKFSPQAVGKAILDGAEALQEEFGLTSTQAAGLSERTETESALEIQEWPVPDEVTIKFNLAREGSAARYRDLSRLSVGQKATCILLLLLAQEERPLVIDQPEDDLDNRFIYDDVVERLREVKDRRQLILATHNANIPVLGDGELIAVLETEEEGGRAVGKVAETGSIDSPAIKLAVTQILEGGREAFQRRQEKYGLPMQEDESGSA
jgi:hypothetical protein